MKTILRKIEHSLKGLDKKQKQEILDYYEEVINDRLERKETLEQIERTIDYNEIKKTYFPQVIYQSENKKVKESFMTTGRLLLYLFSSPLWIPLAILYFVLVLVIWVLMFTFILIAFLLPVTLIIASIKVALDGYETPVVLLTIGYVLLGSSIILPLFYYLSKGLKKINDYSIKAVGKLLGGAKKAGNLQ